MARAFSQLLFATVPKYLCLQLLFCLLMPLIVFSIAPAAYAQSSLMYIFVHFVELLRVLTSLYCSFFHIEKNHLSTLWPYLLAMTIAILGTIVAGLQRSSPVYALISLSIGYLVALILVAKQVYALTPYLRSPGLSFLFPLLLVLASLFLTYYLPNPLQLADCLFRLVASFAISLILYIAYWRKPSSLGLCNTNLS